MQLKFAVSIYIGTSSFNLKQPFQPIPRCLKSTFYRVIDVRTMNFDPSTEAIKAIFANPINKGFIWTTGKSVWIS